MIEDNLIKTNSRLFQASSRLDACDVIDTNVYCKSPTNSSESEDSAVLPSKSYHMKESGAADINTQKPGSSSTKTFPEILKEILSDPENKDAISWLPSGKSFLVLDRKIFVQKVLPKYLGKATKYTSFTRKLSRWNFVRISNGPDEGAWMNKSFFREHVDDDLKDMRCVKRKLSQPIKEIPRSKPLKKRPVDASLFSDIPKPQHENSQISLLENLPVYPYNTSRPLALADTQSVVQAAMRALIQSRPVLAPSGPPLVRSSNSLYPYLQTSAVMNPNMLSALQAVRKGYHPR